MRSTSNAVPVGKFIYVQFKSNGKDRKHCGKRKKCWLPAFSPFLTMFSKECFFKVIESWKCVVRVNKQSHALTRLVLITQRKKPFENIVGKGENAGYQHFFPF